jgi:hypothetical protein
MSTQPDSRIPDHSSVCTTGLQSQILTGIFLQLARNHFSDRDNIEEPRLRENLWVGQAPDYILPDVNKSKILIEPVHRWDTRLIQQRPAIMIKRNATQPQKIAIKNELQMINGPMLEDLPENSRKFYLPLRSSHTLFCVSTDGGAAELLSTEIARAIYQVGELLISEFGFNTFDLGQIGAVARLEQSKEHFAVPVVFVYSFADYWKLTKQEPRFKGVSLGVEPG